MKKVVYIIIFFTLIMNVLWGQERIQTPDSLTTKDSVKYSSATITIQRVRQNHSLLRKVSILVDGQKIGKIANGETKSFSVSAGNHTIVAKIDWCKSPELDFYIQSDYTKNLLLCFTDSFFLSMYQCVFDTKNYMKLIELK